MCIEFWETIHNISLLYIRMSAMFIFHDNNHECSYNIKSLPWLTGKMLLKCQRLRWLTDTRLLPDTGTHAYCQNTQKHFNWETDQKRKCTRLNKPTNIWPRKTSFILVLASVPFWLGMRYYLRVRVVQGFGLINLVRYCTVNICTFSVLKPLFFIVTLSLLRYQIFVQLYRCWEKIHAEDYFFYEKLFNISLTSSVFIHCRKRSILSWKM